MRDDDGVRRIARTVGLSLPQDTWTEMLSILSRSSSTPNPGPSGSRMWPRSS